MSNRKIDPLSTKSRNWAGSYSYSFEAHDSQGQLRADCIGHSGFHYMEEPLSLNRNSIPNPEWAAVKRAWEDSLKERWTDCVLKPDNAVLAVTVVFHDNDIVEEEDGTKHYKGLHAQFCVHTEPTTKGAVMVALNLPRDAGSVGNLNHIVNIAASYRYLLHISKEAINENKHVYSEDELMVISADCGKFNKDWARGQMIETEEMLKRQKQKEQQNIGKLRDQVLMNVMIGAMTRQEAQAVYIKNDGLGISKYFDDLQRFDKAESEYLTRVSAFYSNPDNHFCRLFVLFTGDGGNGKSKVAQAVAGRLADKRGVFISTARASSTFDPFQDYSGQRVAVFDEMRGRSWGKQDKDQFLLAFDPTHINRQSARYHNIFFCASYVFATTTETVSEFTDNLLMASISPDNPYRARMDFWFDSGGIRDDKGGDCCPFWSDFKPGARYSGPGANDYSDKVSVYTGTPLDDLWQIRRRIAIVVDCKKIDESHLELSFFYRLDSPPAGIHARYTFTADELYWPFGNMVYDLRDDKSLDDLMYYFSCVEKTYYNNNGYMNTPDTMAELTPAALLGVNVPLNITEEKQEDE